MTHRFHVLYKTNKDGELLFQFKITSNTEKVFQVRKAGERKIHLGINEDVDKQPYFLSMITFLKSAKI